MNRRSSRVPSTFWLLVACLAFAVGCAAVLGLDEFTDVAGTEGGGGSPGGGGSGGAGGQATGGGITGE